MLSIIIPCYNECDRLDMPAFEQFLTGQIGVALCFVNDGSTDDTAKKLHALAGQFADKVSVLDLTQNGGKAEAIRAGCLYALTHLRPDCIAYLDADLSVPLPELMRIYQVMAEQQLLIIFGARVALFGYQIQRRSHRHYLGRLFATVASMVLNTVIYDTQCGAKIFTREVARKVFEKPFVSRWFFDVEIIARLNQLYGADILVKILREIPLNIWIHKEQSKIKIKDFFLCPYYLFRIKRKYRIKTPSRN